MSKSTQLGSTEFSIPFTLSHDSRSFRLLELPDELVRLISDGTVPTLHLKSSSLHSTSFLTDKEQETPRTKAAEYVHLCSEQLEKTWNVRQVSTSNEVYIVQPSWQYKISNEDTMMNGNTTTGESGPRTVALTVIAKADSMLELLPTSVDVETILRRRLPSYNTEQFQRAQGQSDNHLHGEEVDLKEQIFADIPAPNITIQRAWRELCVSKMISKRSDVSEKYFIPDSNILVGAWNAAIESFYVKGDGNKEMEKRDFEGKDDGLDELTTVSEAIWRMLCSDGSSGLDRGKTSRWLGQTLLHEATMNSTDEYPYELAKFLAKWAESLPRAWATDAEVAKLGAQSYEIGNVDGIQMIRSTRKHFQSARASGATTPTPTTATGKRKWHEKFREQRNVKK